MGDGDGEGVQPALGHRQVLGHPALRPISYRQQIVPEHVAAEHQNVPAVPPLQQTMSFRTLPLPFMRAPLARLGG
jgi:hypothetical protein